MADATVDALITQTTDPAEEVTTTEYDPPVDTAFDATDTLVSEAVPGAAPAAAAGPNWPLIGGGIAAGVVVIGAIGYFTMGKN